MPCTTRPRTMTWSPSPGGSDDKDAAQKELEPGSENHESEDAALGSPIHKENKDENKDAALGCGSVGQSPSPIHKEDKEVNFIDEPNDEPKWEFKFINGKVLDIELDDDDVVFKEHKSPRGIVNVTPPGKSRSSPEENINPPEEKSRSSTRRMK